MAKIKHITDKHGEIVYPISKEGAIYDDNGVLLSSKISTFITRLVDNLANYYLKSETYTKGEVDSMISAIQGFTCIVVPELPTASAETMGAIYLVPSEDPQTQNVKDEYITIRSGVEGSYTYSWEQIGSTAIDLSGYVTTEELNTELANYTTTANLTTLLAGKQDTIADLASIRSGASLGATAYQKPSSGIPASDIAAGVIPDISGKQDVIPDLSTIRSGAAAGATAYQKPSGGIPATDMASGVQTSLGKADSAYQKPSGGIPKTDLASGVQDSLELADSAVQADPIGSIVPPVDPSEFATKEEVEGLEAKVTDLDAVKDGTIDTVKSENLLNPAACVKGYIDKTTGSVVTINDRYASDFIPVSENGLYCNAYNGYGNAGRAVVYDANKQYLRYFESQAYIYQSGDAFVRWTLDKTKVETPTAYCIEANKTREYTPYFEPKYYVKDEAVPGLPILRADVSGIKNKVAGDEQRVFGKVFSSADYCGFYVSNFFTGAISPALATANGYFIPVTEGGTYTIESTEFQYTQDNSLHFYNSDEPGADSFVARATLEDGKFIVPSGAKYLLISVSPDDNGSTRLSGYNTVSEDSLPLSLYKRILGIHLKDSYTFTSALQNHKMFNVQIRAGETFRFKVSGAFEFGRIGFYTNSGWAADDSHDNLVNGEEYIWTAISDITEIWLFQLSGNYGEVTAKFDFDGAVDKTADNSGVLPAVSLCGKDCIKATAASIAASGSLQITDFPQYLKGNGVVSFFAKLTSFNDISVGFGTSTNSIQVKVDGTNIYFIKSGSQIGSAVAHGLTISDFIDITFDNDFFAPKVVVASASGLFVHDRVEFPSLESYGYPVAVMGTGTAVTDAELRATSDKFNKPIWVVGDSYTSFYDERWTKQMVKTIGVDKFLVIGLAGGGSSGMYADLQKALAFGTPKFLLWCLGMNDDEEGWGAVFDNLKTLCASMGTELVLQTIPIPNLETSSNQEAINTAIKASGYRYIDACAAMCPNNSWPWYEGYCADGVHPTVLGAKVLAARFLSDFPEFLQ